MKIVRLICEKCGHKMERPVADPGGTDEKMSTGGCTIKCEKCGGRMEKM